MPLMREPKGRVKSSMGGDLRVGGNLTDVAVLDL